jgi:tRNA (guanine37-N1)-methyltransferase
VRIDIVSIFPDYLAPLELSLPGKARDKGLLDLQVHDLRDWAHDRHRTVDDSPAGGGAGMVMKPEPWGEALDALVTPETTIIFTTPSGEPFTQVLARELSERPHLVFACGRYEGIDQRVIDHAGAIARVREISIGDYVLNGGEVAALAITEAVIRLLPGFMGNPDSLLEESYEDGLLEYPVYTKPATWRGLEIPPVLLSGDHGRIAAWRHEQAVRRTAERRPDLLHPSRVVDGLELKRATLGDAAELLTLQRACWVQEAQANDTLDIPALHESLAEVEADLRRWDTWVARSAGRLVGSARGRLDGDVWHIGRLMVAPDLQGRGIGRQLLALIERVAPPDAASYSLFTGSRSESNLRRYRRAGYRVGRGTDAPEGVAVLTKRRVERPEPPPRRTAPNPHDDNAAIPGEVTIATSADAGEFMTLQWACFPPYLHEPLDVLTRDITSAPTYLLRRGGGRLMGAIRAEVHADLCHLSLLMVVPDQQGEGLGRYLLRYAERNAPAAVTDFQVFVAEDNDANRAFYERAGFTVSGEQAPGVVRLTKQRVISAR